MANANINLQDVFLNTVRTENVGVTMFLINGFQIKGTVKSFDAFTVEIESEGRQQVVYKHAISTIMPVRNVTMSQQNPI